MCVHHSVISICLVTFEMFANHKDVSHILRVESKRETITTQAMLESKNIDDFSKA